MNVFEAVKANVTTRKAAEIFGFKPNRKGMMLCPFHDDHHPSMLVDERYYCFGCGATGDVIDFASKLTGRDATKAALELAEMFDVSYEYKGRRITGNGK